MNVVFYNRDFTNKIALPKSINVEVERYSWKMIGGPDEAILTANVGADKFDLLKLLRAPIEIYGEGGKLVWYGFVNRITAPNGPKQSVGLTLDEMYNYVTVDYLDGTTAASSNTNSINEYGQKEARFSRSNETQTEAQQSRNLYLADHHKAIQEFRATGGRSEIEFQCYGWYATLGWKYYSNSTVGNIENTTQISAIVTSAGQFLQGAIIEDTAGITSNEYRDGKSTALTYVNQLLDAGTSNIRPLLAHVDEDRYLHVYERPVEPPANKPRLLWRGDGRLETALGKIVPDQECRVAEWMKVKDVPDTLGGFSTLRSAFIEKSEYNAKERRTSYYPANSYEQTKLAKYIAQITSGQSDGTGGAGYVPPIFWTPEPEPLSLDMRHVYTTAFASTDIASNLYIYTNSAYAFGITIGNPKLTYGSVGGGLYSGHIPNENGYYIVHAYASVKNGTSTPSNGNGYFQLELFRMNVANAAGVTFAENQVTYPGDGLGTETAVIQVSGGVYATTTTGILLRFLNATDGDLRVSELNYLIWKVK